MELFEKATKLKLRFNNGKGNYTTEDLWTLELTELDEIAKRVYTAIKQAEEISFIQTKTKANTKLELELEVLKHIIAFKLAEKDAKKIADAKRDEKNKILDLIAKKKDEALGSESLEDLQKRLEAI